MLVAPYRLSILAGAVHTDGHDIAVDQPVAVVAPFVVVVVTEKPGAVGEPLVHLLQKPLVCGITSWTRPPFHIRSGKEPSRAWFSWLPSTKHVVHGFPSSHLSQ